MKFRIVFWDVDTNTSNPDDPSHSFVTGNKSLAAWLSKNSQVTILRIECNV